MASLKDASKVAEELEQLVHRLHEEIAGGRADLVGVVALADEIAEFADSLAETFAAIDGELSRRLAATRAGDGRSAAKRGPRRRGGRRAVGAATAEAKDGATKTELLEQAKEAVVPGRSSMSKEELAGAVESQERLTKDQLLEQAKAAGIPGRSEMSKRELIAALRKEASASRDELLERAKEADIPGRSEMSKDELRKALQKS